MKDIPVATERPNDTSDDGKIYGNAQMSTPLECVEKDEGEQARFEEAEGKGEAYCPNAVVGMEAVRERGNERVCVVSIILLCDGLSLLCVWWRLR